MIKSLASAAVITAAGSLLISGGAFSIFSDAQSSAGSFAAGTVKLKVTSARPGAATEAIVPTNCVQPYVKALTSDQNLGTVNNTSCDSNFTVGNAGSLPFELSGTTLSDSKPGGLTCFTSTIVSGITKTLELVPGASRTVVIHTATVSDLAGCQGQTDTVTANLVAVETTLTPRALILDTTVVGGASSLEAATLAAQGVAVDVVTAAQWGAMTASQFGGYSEIVLGDRTCGADYSAASANAATWVPVITGHQVLYAGDPEFHATNGANAAGARAYMVTALSYALGRAGKPGLYVAFGCGNASELFSTLDPGLVAGGGYGDNVSVVGTEPGLSSLTSASLSAWHSSTHGSFASVPSTYGVFATDGGSQVLGVFRK